MAPKAVTEDYYAVLGVIMTADAQAIRAAYRKLARVTHPDKNPSPNSKEEFQRIQAAYETLNDPTARKLYDDMRPKASAYSQPFASSAPGTSSQREYSKTGADTASEEAKKAARALSLERLHAQRARQEMDMFESRRSMKKLEAELAHLQEEDDLEALKAANQNSWWGALSSAVFGISSQELKDERERRRLNRSAAIRIKTMDLSNKTRKLSALETAAKQTVAAIAQLKQQIFAEEQKQEAERQAQARARREMYEEMLRRSQEAKLERERMAREQQDRERIERERKERERIAREQKEWERMLRELEERERLQRETMERERIERKRKAQKEKQAGSRKAADKRQTRAQKQADESQRACFHRGWWDEVPGRTTCSICSTTLTKFALECPGCHIKACASCKRTLKGSGGHRGGFGTK
ncbi:hypothetical protein HD806DRAFT_500978 [Xylariaceae sp. AK1471]|nr:hypothetical protein HD806DRAFT_500978 [Xylariaceae sp. AK1471]